MVPPSTWRLSLNRVGMMHRHRSSSMGSSVQVRVSPTAGRMTTVEPGSRSMVAVIVGRLVLSFERAMFPKSLKYRSRRRLAPVPGWSSLRTSSRSDRPALNCCCWSPSTPMCRSTAVVTVGRPVRVRIPGPTMSPLKSSTCRSRTSFAPVPGWLSLRMSSRSDWPMKCRCLTSSTRTCRSTATTIVGRPWMANKSGRTLSTFASRTTWNRPPVAKTSAWSRK